MITELNNAELIFGQSV